jgi:hypothetical protein
MGHYIDGFVAKYELLAAAAKNVPEARVCRIGLGYGFFPMTDAVTREDDSAANYDFLYRLTCPMANWAVENSRQFPIAYVATDYFGGNGSQSALVWKDGAVIFGPIETKDNQLVSTPLLDLAINQAMRHLGVQRGTARDEFEAIGLGRCSDNVKWVAAADADAAGKK